MELSDLKRMKALEKENGKLKKLFVEQAFELEAIKMLLAKKWRAGNRNEGRSCSSSQNLESENLVAS
ncbi:ISBp1, transposase A family protein [Leptospira santarosai str. 2000030832]|nr:ISBp1, transposase A family protein [Leptospira santarosai str. 2000030832]